MSKALHIKDYPNYYVTDCGDVYSRNFHREKRIKKLKQRVDKYGYFVVQLSKNGKEIHKSVHRLVADAFIPNPENKPQVNHIDGDKQNNKVSNLEWVTNAENILHSFKNLGRKGTNLGKLGKENPMSKIVLQIKDGKIIAEFYGTHEAQRITNIPSQSISACCLGKLKTTGGYEWKYKR